jgi:hypothetical protein
MKNYFDELEPFYHVGQKMQEEYLVIRMQGSSIQVCLCLFRLIRKMNC